MISYLEGKLTEIYDDRITLLVGGIGYDILIPAYVMSEIKRDVKIEGKETKSLKQLKGIGERKAEKIIATLKGKVAMYALMPEVELPTEVAEDFRKEVEDVLVQQLGHKLIEARKMIEEAMKRNPRIISSEELFEEVYRGQKK